MCNKENEAQALKNQIERHKHNSVDLMSLVPVSEVLGFALVFKVLFFFFQFGKLSIYQQKHTYNEITLENNMPIKAGVKCAKDRNKRDYVLSFVQYRTFLSTNNVTGHV